MVRRPRRPPDGIARLVAKRAMTKAPPAGGSERAEGALFQACVEGAAWTAASGPTGRSAARRRLRPGPRHGHGRRMPAEGASTPGIRPLPGRCWLLLRALRHGTPRPSNPLLRPRGAGRLRPSDAPGRGGRGRREAARRRPRTSWAKAPATERAALARQPNEWPSTARGPPPMSVHASAHAWSGPVMPAGGWSHGQRHHFTLSARGRDIPGRNGWTDPWTQGGHAPICSWTWGGRCPGPCPGSAPVCPG
jgi:hypothetical protein